MKKICIHAVITGWVRNIPSNQVELMAYGEENAIQLFIAWLWQGPPRAQVTDVIWHSVPIQEFDEFIIMHG